ncbi:MAG: cyclopropane-fatty-acyl-phospholipid synthase [Actinomycetota bacterium]|nr:cyclopropane-fatty-acyl-phospholipid synthase [Actinomycetota bacterium]
MSGVRTLQLAARRLRPGAHRAARVIVLGLLEGVAGGELVVEDPMGTSRFGPSGGLRASVRVTDGRAFRAVIGAGSVGLAEGYIEGWWDCDDLVALLQIAARRLGPTRPVLERLSTLRGALIDAVDRRRASLARDRRNIAAHYDLGNDFFSCFLDPTLSYSCGVFSSPDEAMEVASRRKLDGICAKLALRPGDHVLEIGTGWGAFALHAARRYGCRVTTTTISSRQYDHARAAVDAAGLAGQVQVLNVDYRELEGRFDKLVSIEMIEAVDWRDYPSFFGHCAKLLGDEGLMALQAIVIDERHYAAARRRQDFIKAMVFPGSCIPSIGALTSALARGGDLSLVHLEDIGAHYAETIERWSQAFAAHRAQVAALGFDARFMRLWEFYLAYCRAGFLERRISDVQAILAKSGWQATLSESLRGWT